QGRVDLVTVIAAAIDAFRPAADAKSLSIEARLDPVASVTGDGDRLEQVVSNLLSNAVKFTPVGGRIEVRLDCDGEHCRSEVADTGEGIPGAFLPHVFDRFRQLDSGPTRSRGSAWAWRSPGTWWSCTAGRSRRPARVRARGRGSRSASPRARASFPTGAGPS